MRTVREKVQGASFLDFELGENIPTEWEQLRSEARELLKKEIGVNEKVTRLFSTTLKQVCF
jgi:hypothetical protein